MLDSSNKRIRGAFAQATSSAASSTEHMGSSTRIIRHRLVAYCLPVGILGVLVILLHVTPARAAAGINQEVNFQGRLLNSQGAIVPDGFYNIEFKIYQDGDGQSVGDTTGTPAGALKWTEDYLNTGTTQGVEVRNGFLSVQLGSRTPFGSSINWNQDTLWLSMDVGNTATCTLTTTFDTDCSGDGEMVPMKRLSSTPYALNASQLNGFSSGQFVQLAQGLQTDSSNNNSIYINKTGSGNLLDLQASGADAFILTGSGDATFGANTDHTLSVATAAAGTAGKALTIAAGAAGTGSAVNGGSLVLQGGAASGTGTAGSVIVKANGSNSAGTFQVQNASAGTVLAVDTANNAIVIGNDGTPVAMTIRGGAANGSNATGANLTLDASNGTGSGGSGALIFRTAASAAAAPITLDNAQSATFGGNTNTTVTWTHTPGAHSNQVLVVGIVTARNNSVSSLTYEGTPLTKVAAQQCGNGVFSPYCEAELWYLPNPSTSGTHQISVTVTPGSTVIAGGSATYYNVDTTNTFGTSHASFGTTGGNQQVTNPVATTSTSQLIIDVLASDNTTGTPGGTQLWNSNGNGFDFNHGSSTPANGGSTNVTWMVNSGDWADVAAPLNQAPNTSPNILQDRLHIAASGNVGISNSNPQYALDVTGAGRFTTSVLTQLLDTASAGALGVGGSNATSIAFATNGITRGTFGTANDFYFGNGVTAAAPNNFTIQGTGSATSAVAGATLTIQGGNATVGSANGGNLTLSGGTGIGTGVNGLVVLSTPTFAATINDPNCYTGGALVASTCTIAQATVDGSSTVIVGFSQTAQTAFLPAPTNTTVGRVFYITAANGSKDFTLSVNGGGTGNEVAMRQNTSATMVWNGTAWAAAGASSSTTLQAAYDNTLQSAGGAELVVSHTSNTNGLTIRDSTVNPVNSTLLSVQTSSAATLISINANVTEYASDGGAETSDGTPNTFPAGTWSAIGGAAVTRYTTVGNFIATGQGSASVVTSTAAQDGIKNTLVNSLTPNVHYNVSFAARLSSGTFTDLNVYYSIDGTAASVQCATSKAVTTSIWTKVNCAFAAPASGITASNAILIRQTGSGTARTFYIDNLSVTIAADYNYATDPGVDDALNFTTNWTSVNSATVTRNTTIGNDASDSAEADTTTSGQGVRNKLSVNLLPNNLYRVTVYVASIDPSFNSFDVKYSRDGGTNFKECTDYNTQSIIPTLTSFTEITCYISTDATAATNPYVYFTQTDATARTFYVDTFSITLSTETTPNVQIGGGVNGGPVTLLTLDRAASAPIASNNDAFLGSLYYDTTLGELQCYESSGWGSCGSSPNTVVTISPEYNNAVMHGTGVGTMTSDLCSGTLGINDGTSGQPTICSSSETFNFYKWTSPQASAQTYSIYVTYQLPDTFKAFASGQTSITGRIDSTNAEVQYTVYRDDPVTGLARCGSAVVIASGAGDVNSWKTQTAAGAADPSTCGFVPNESIVFQIDMTASQNADAYVGNLNFTFSHK